MQKRIKRIGLFLLISLLFIGVMGLAHAAVTVDTVTRTIEIDGGTYTLDSIWADAGVSDLNLTNETGGVWLLNYSILVQGDATLLLNPDGGCTWLKMNDTNATGVYESHIYVEGRLFVNNTRITGWNYTADTNSTNFSRFRPYIYIAPVTGGDLAEAYFLNSTIGYLGFDMDNRYGIVYEVETDIDVAATGWMHNCTVMENYIGINFQGCENMNVTDSYFNNSIEAGIVYTIGGASGIGAHGGYVGDLVDAALVAGQYDGVTVIDSYGDATAMGIRLYSSDNITLEDVTINNATTDGLRIESCNNLTANNTVSYLNTDAADDYNIYLHNCTNSTFTNCTAYSPNGTTDGGNWMLAGGGGNNSHHNSFTSCRGYDATSLYDFYIWHSDTNLFVTCYANNSDMGYYVSQGHNNTFINCEARTHVSYNYKILGSPYNNIIGGYANSSAVGILIADDTDTYVSHHNEILGVDVNLATGYAISIGTDGGIDNICHNNTVTNVIVTGTTTGDGIFLFDNVTYNNISGCAVLDLTPVASGGMGATNWADYNTFYNCSSMSNGGIGYYLLGNASYNAITLCEAGGNRYGIRMADYANNNTVNHSDFNNNTWVGIWAASAGASAGGNVVWSSTCHDNFMGIVVEFSPLVSFTEVDAYNNTVYGAAVTDGASAYFFNCIVSNQTVAQYDWYVDDTSTADIYSPYILGFDKDINYQFDITQPYGVASHDAGDGLWELNTTQMTVRCQAANTSYVNLTSWSSTSITWTANATTGTQVYQKIGGLVPGVAYDLVVSGSTQSTNYSTAGTMLETHGATGYVWFNYTGSWSAIDFEVKRHVVPDGNGDTTPPDDEDVDTDGDGWTDVEELAAGSDPNDPNSTPLTVAELAFFGVAWYWWVGLATVVVLLVAAIYFVAFPKAWKKFRGKR